MNRLLKLSRWVVAVVLAMVPTLSFASNWYLVGANYGWTEKAENKFVDNGDDTYSLNVATLSGDIKIKEEGVWSTSFGSNGSKLQKNTTYYASYDGGNIVVDGIISNATITIDTYDHTVYVTGRAAENTYTSVYLIGDFGNDWSEDIADGIELVKTGTNTYTADFTLTADLNYFKFKAGANVYGTGGMDIEVETDVYYGIYQSGNAFVLGAGEYSISLSLEKNAEVGEFIIEGKAVDNEYTSVYLIGDFGNDWSEDIADGIELRPAGTGVYRANFDLTAELNYFKFKAGNIIYSTGDDDIEVEMGQSYETFRTAGYAFILGAGTYSITLNLAKNASSGTFTITGTPAPNPDPEPDPDPDPDPAAKVVYINPFTINPGETKTVDVMLDTPDYDVNSIQLDIVMPHGLAIEKEDGELVIDLTSRAASKSGFQVVASEMAGGDIRVVVYSNKNSSLLNRSGAVLTISVVAAEDFAGGDIVMKNIMVFDSNATYHYPESTACNVALTQQEPEPDPEPDPEPEPDNSPNRLYGENMKVYRNNDFVVSVAMANEVPISAFQCDIVVPEGLSIAMDEDEYDILLGSRAHRSHDITTARHSNGNVRVICYSMKVALFSGNDGELFTIPFEPATTPGVYELKLINIELSDASAKRYSPGDATIKIEVVAFPAGDANGDGEVTVTDVVAVSNHILGKTPDNFVPEAADANKDGEITISDVVFIANLILRQTANAPAKAEATDSGSLYIDSFTITAGTTKDVEIKIDTPDYDITAFQVDLTMPEGLTIEEDGGEYIFDITDRAPRRSGHQAQSNTLSDGCIRVLCYSSKSINFDDREGAVLTFPAVAAADFKGGDIELTNIEVVEKDGSKHRLAPVTVKVSETSGVELVGSDNAEAVYYNLQGVRVANPDRGVFIKVTGNKAVKVII